MNPAVHTPKSNHDRPNRRQTLLAINNSRDALALFVGLPGDEGYEVEIQPYIEKSLDTLVEFSPDLIILDYKWAFGDDGWSCLQMIRMDCRTVSIPVIVCTGAGREVETLPNHLDEMNVEVNLKPFDIDALLRAMSSKLIGSSRQSQPEVPVS